MRVHASFPHRRSFLSRAQPRAPWGPANWLLAAGLGAAVACTGNLSTPGERAGGGAAPDSSPDAAAGTFAGSPGLRRLTRAEYANTLRNLLEVEVDTARVPRELLVRGHSQIGGAQRTGYADLEAYYQLALAAAEQVAPDVLAELGCSSAACLEDWLAGFFGRALRGTLEGAAVAEFRSLLDEPDAGATLTERFITLLTAVLTSPSFLYKQEIGSEAPVAGVSPLAPHEVATRLSYLVWQSGPDEELLVLGDALSDPDVRLAQLERMLADARARPGLRGFVLDWMGVFDNQLPNKDVGVLEGLQPEFAAAAQQSLDLLIDAELLNGAGRYASLLTTQRLFANDVLAPVYGLSGLEGEFQELTVESANQKGILAHPMVIGAHSKESGASPFPIGEFIFENLLCETVPPPPPGIPIVPDEDDSDLTLRERLEAATRGEPCYSCHVRIGPPGFAFLPFDPVGRYEALDGVGRPYDTRGELVVPGRETPVAFDGVAQLSQVLSEQAAVADCVAKRLFRWTHGRFEATTDQEQLGQLGGTAVATDTSVEALLRAIVAAPSFAQVRILH